MHQKQKQKIIISIVACLALTALGSSLWLSLFYRPPGDLEVAILDVGQGDSILVRTPLGQNILIDGGPDNRVLRRLGEELPFWDRRIDLAVLTHPHEDHLLGLIEVMKRYRVKRLVYSGARLDSADYRAWADLARAKNLPVTIIDRPQTIDFGGGAKLEILRPDKNLNGGNQARPNNDSIVSRLVFKTTGFLLLGDLETAGEQELLSADAELKSDVVKIAHHGSDTASSEDFLEKISPKIAVISVGENNKFGHPSRSVINRLDRLGARILRTDLSGTIRLISDGLEVTSENL